MNMNEEFIIKAIASYVSLILGIYIVHRTRHNELTWRILVAIVFFPSFLIYHIFRFIKRIIRSFISGLQEGHNNENSLQG